MPGHFLNQCWFSTYWITGSNIIVVLDIATKMLHMRQSTAVVSCAKFHSDHFTTTWIREEWSCLWNWITMGKSVREMDPSLVSGTWMTSTCFQLVCLSGLWEVGWWAPRLLASSAGSLADCARVTASGMRTLARVASRQVRHWGVQTVAPSYLNLVRLTRLLLNKIVAISQTIFSDAFSWMKSFVFWLKFHWSLFPSVQLIIAQHWFR